ncbi:hypothetical protein BC440_14240 [Thalassospira sp. MIT1004]|jgi:protein-tyrosine-phosphatase|nr:protein tyrosine phosphatase [Thalassospira sp. KO164]OHZ02116.1 hypothetical protein BC440_14240 [Thalassospira sp. MIT1004]SED55894.1 Protein-tyrosine-phosphatase [Thalassospira permensis]|tara:strand:+ start:759 stop:1187 length:429 start_codon:yes stop_codon:yes gene_type:complete
MAAAIARQYARQHKLPITPHSAGIHAREGDAITPESEFALRQIGIAGNHTSRGLSREILESSHVIFVMEAWQAEAIEASMEGYAFSCPPPVRMLDHTADIVDPLGRGQAVYDELVCRFRELIPARLSELEISAIPEGRPRCP